MTYEVLEREDGSLRVNYKEIPTLVCFTKEGLEYAKETLEKAVIMHVEFSLQEASLDGWQKRALPFLEDLEKLMALVGNHSYAVSLKLLISNARIL